jgi:hypothetical protein
MGACMRVYIDTSVIGGCLDNEFAEWSVRLVREFEIGRKTAVVSDLARAELDAAPLNVKAVFNRIPENSLEFVSMGDSSIALAEAYIREGAIGPGSLADALHIAMATVARVDVLVSWNFKHIVNWRRNRMYNAVNLKEGYGMIDIRSPREVLDEEEI